MSRRSRTSLHAVGEINLTPLLDFAFLLVTIFLITYPLMEQGINVNLPIGKADPLKPDRSRTITVNLDGHIYLDNKAIVLEELAAEMTRQGKADPEITVFVRADKDLRYGRVVDVMRILHDAQIGKMALVAQAE